MDLNIVLAPHNVASYETARVELAQQHIHVGVVIR
jgi:hypothetical protein